jgi:hypothetical protein
MTNSKLSDRTNVCSLDDAELDTVIGGALDACIPHQTIQGILVNTSWTFKDLWAKPTLGTYH